MTDLTRSPARVVGAVREGEVVVLSKHGRAVAMIVPLFDEPELAPLDVGRLEGLARLAAEFRERDAERKASAFMHGRRGRG